MNNRKTNLLILAALCLLATSCSLVKPKYGCPTNGTNVGAERLLSDPPKKVKKFKA